MEGPDKIETRREITFNAAGEKTGVIITYETPAKRPNQLERKDYIDIIIKVFGIVAIFIPVWLFYSQQKIEIRKQKALLEYDAYSKLSVELHKYATCVNAVINQTFDDSAKEQAAQKSRDYLLFELIPRSNLFHNDIVDNELKRLTYQVRSIFDYNQLVTKRFDVYYNMSHEIQWDKGQYGWQSDPEFPKYIHFNFTQRWLDAYEEFMKDSVNKIQLFDSLFINGLTEYSLMDSLMSIVQHSYDLKKPDIRIFNTFLDTDDKMGALTNQDADIIPRVVKQFEQSISRFDSLIVASNEFAQ
jgi:hypothetical protein